MQALAQAQGVDAGAIAAACEKPADIPLRIAAARVAAITGPLKSWKAGLTQA